MTAASGRRSTGWRSSWSKPGLALLLALLACSSAAARSWSSYRLGEFYDVETVTDPVIRRAAEAVLWFGNATGFVVSPDGYILTNHHVYQSFGTRGTVWRHWTSRGYRQSLDVELVTASRTYDVAVYRARASGLPFIPLRTTSARIGEDVFIVGHPNSRAQEVSFGRVLATGLVIAGRPSIEYSAQTWWGSSGSPVCDRQGRALAIHWGWDAEGLSHGRLTGVPFDLMARALPPIAQLAGAGGAAGSATPVAGTPASSGTGSGSTSGSAAARVRHLGLGVPVRDTLARTGEHHYYRLEVPVTGEVAIALEGTGAADLDLAVYRWYATGQLRRLGASTSPGAREALRLERAEAGTYLVIAYSYQGASAYALRAEQPRPGGGAAGGAGGSVVASARGQLAGAGGWRAWSYRASGGALRLELDGPPGSDFDLYVFRLTAAGSPELVAHAASPAADEVLSLRTTAGTTYYLVVHSARGAGAFQLRLVR
ncbi:MAG: hypothetical protein KatS3mg102_1520 [Planctomycetota bacterium]|nr:MAG: hypothetical protein KatS3mg102_1520 [Planctomycetota bacterium]